MANIFETLRAEHDKHRTLIDLVGKTHGDSEGRRELFEKLEREVRIHAAAEERVFYAELMSHELTGEKARHSVAEHKEAADLLDELSQKDYSSPGWIQRYEKLKEELLHHMDEEEHQVFQLAGKALTETQKHELVARFEAAKQEHAPKV